MPEPVLIDVRLVDGPVDYAPLTPFPVEAGGECVFLGGRRVETHAGHGALRRLSYEAYPSMAERVLRDLAEQAIARYDGRAVRILHATGEVTPGAASVLVQVACGHRAEAFAACRFLIDELKARAPIWKREEWADGATWSGAAAVPVPAPAPDPSGDQTESTP